VVTKQNTKEYYQVALTVLDERVRERELSPLLKVGDNYPKYLYFRGVRGIKKAKTHLIFKILCKLRGHA